MSLNDIYNLPSSEKLNLIEIFWTVLMIKMQSL